MSQDVKSILANMKTVQASQGDAYLPYIRPIHPMSDSPVANEKWALGKDKDLGDTIDMCLVKFRLTLEAEEGTGEDKETVTATIYPEDCEGSWAEEQTFIDFMKKPGASYNVDALIYLPAEDVFGIHSVKQRRMDNFYAIVNASAPLSGDVATLKATLQKGRGNRSWFTMTATPTSQDKVNLEAHPLYETSVLIFDSNKDA